MRDYAVIGNDARSRSSLATAQSTGCRFPIWIRRAGRGDPGQRDIAYTAMVGSFAALGG